MAVYFCVVDYLVINEFVNYSYTLKNLTLPKEISVRLCVHQGTEQLCCSFGAHFSTTDNSH